jgi:MFS family permease
MSARPGETKKRRARQLPRLYWVLWAGTLVNRAGTMVQPFLAFYLTGDRGLPIAEAGLILTAFGLGSVLSPLPAGWLADRAGRRVTLTAATLASGAAMVALSRSTSPLALSASMCGLGLTLDAWRPASTALVADLVAPPLRPRAYGLLFWASNLGFTGGVLVGGTLVQDHFATAMWIDAATSAAFGLLVWFALPGSEPALTEPTSQITEKRGGFRDVLTDPVMARFTLVTFGYCLFYLQSLTTLPLAMRQAGLPPAAFSYAMAVNSAMIVFLQPWFSARLDRWDRSRTAAAGIALTGIGFGATGLATSTAAFALTVAVWTIGEILVSAVGSAIALDLAPAHLRGHYSGLYGLAWSLATLLAPLLGTRLLSQGGAVLWSACAATALVAAVGQLLLRPAVSARSS